MHAGDGNCHVNIPVNSNDARMLEEAEEAAARVMAECQEMGGEVSGEHGIGTAKAKWLEKETGRGAIEFSRRLRRALDPKGLLNPTKMVEI